MSCYVCKNQLLHCIIDKCENVNVQECIGEKRLQISHKVSVVAVVFFESTDVITSSNHAQAQMRLEQREYRPEGGWGEAIVALRHGTKQPDQL